MGDGRPRRSRPSVESVVYAVGSLPASESRWGTGRHDEANEAFPRPSSLRIQGNLGLCAHRGFGTCGGGPEPPVLELRDRIESRRSKPLLAGTIAGRIVIVDRDRLRYRRVRSGVSEMQSTFFKTTGVETEELGKDLRALERLGSEKLSALQGFLAEGIHLVQRDEAMRSELDEFLDQSSISGEEYQRARRLTQFLVEACERYDDKADAIIQDLNEILPLGDGLRRFFDALTAAMRRAVLARRRGQLARRTVPALVSVTYSCDVRVDLPKFDVFRDDPDGRVAEPRDWVPIALIRFSTDEKEDLSCQVDLENLRQVIAILRAAEGDLTRVQQRLSKAGLA
jgi:hypothetical protein